MIIQRWTGYVSRIEQATFFAVMSDAMDPSNPVEEMEFARDRVDSSQLAVGAPVTLVIESELRIVKYPPITPDEMREIEAEAARVAEILQAS